MVSYEVKMTDFSATMIWQRTLAPQNPDSHPIERERLRNAYLNFRSRAALLAAEISRDLPEFTVHDITHIDALWEMADLIAGEEYPLTPAEAFILGGAFLIHDLGNALAAYPGGIKGLKKQPLWSDKVTILLKEKLGRSPSPEEFENLDPEIEIKAKEAVLRELHAQRAGKLALVSWKDGKGTEYHLLEDPDLRRNYGPIIGLIATSHWWPIDRLAKELDKILGAPVPFPKEWIADILKLSAMLRTADASHLDARRAPDFLCAIRKPTEEAKKHWTFQEHLNQPRLENNRLAYTSGIAFPVEEAESWWCCYDALHMVDAELRGADVLLADLGRIRFAARGVSGVEDPQRLKRLIPTDSWEPIDTRIKVTNVAGLVRKLGGEQLYGCDLTVPLRELIQNAIDAVRARRLIERKDEKWGKISVRLGKDSEGDWIEVSDNGIGMSSRVLQGPFLDFGACFWDSDLMLEEFPGLSAKGFQSIGKYGIGFFSVFMWGDRVLITTRRFDAAQKDTFVLEFNSGLSSRPILRKAYDKECLRDGGSIVKIWLRMEPNSVGGLLNWQYGILTIEDICAKLCPSIDVDLLIEHGDNKSIISASDWIDIDGVDFIKRICEKSFIDKKTYNKLIKILNNNLRLIYNQKGEIIGRACISKGEFSKYDVGILDSGVITVGGLRSELLTRIMGILIGENKTAARNTAIPLMNKDEMAKWASEQSRLLIETYADPEDLAECASIIWVLGGDLSNLPIALSSTGWKSISDIVDWKEIPNELLLLSLHSCKESLEKFDKIAINNNVLLYTGGIPGFLSSETTIFTWPTAKIPFEGEGQYDLLYYNTILGAIVEAVAKNWDIPIREVWKNIKLSTSDKENKREIGRIGRKKITRNVSIIRKP